MPCVDLITDYVDEIKTNFKGVDLMIINGLYATKIEKADLRVFIELTYDETKEAQVFCWQRRNDSFQKTDFRA